MNLNGFQLTVLKYSYSKLSFFYFINLLVLFYTGHSIIEIIIIIIIILIYDSIIIIEIFLYWH